ncbi:MAG: glycosyltransferase [Mycolicibacterium cosmeticum]|nr:glycosyltransferase [Mycolicibacterium cosmeticum]
MRPLRLLQVTRTLDPAYGGPCVVVNQFTRNLTDLGHSVEVVTLDASSEPWLAKVPGHVYALGPARGRYGYTRCLRTWLRQHATDFDAVAVHGVWQYQSQAVRAECLRIGVPYFLFTHGALDPWFEERYPGKHVKKTLYWRLFEHRTLRDAEAVLFTCDEEKTLARTAFLPFAATEAIARLGIDDPPGEPAAQSEAFLAAYPHLRDRRVVLFLGRLHPKKGCDMLIEGFARTCHLDDTLHLVMAGPDEAGTEAPLRALADDLRIGDRITWTGMVNGDVKWGAYRFADVFALPSHSENFGIAIAEALACERPVLISDKVNIWREVQSSGAGLVEPDTIEGTVTLLQRWIDLQDFERADMRRRARACFLDNFDARNTVLDFASVVEGTTRKGGTG